MPPSRHGLVVQFYVLKSVHWAMFEELCGYLAERSEVAEIVVCLPDLALLRADGSNALIEELLARDVTITTHPRQRKVDITFIADAVAGRVRGCGRIVNVGHGTISKGYYFSDSIWTERENWVDLLCVPGPYAKARFDGLLRTHVVATGMPKLDPIFDGRFTRASLCATHRIDPSKRIVLYAPTFNEDLSSAFLFAPRFAELAQDDRVILVKLHGSTPAIIVAHYRELGRTVPGIVFVEDANIAPCLAGADVLISDVSSVVMEFMALDKPVILFNNPNMRRYHGYNATDIEHAWRDLGTETTTFEETASALAQVSTNGDGKSDIRRACAQELLADRHGHAAERVWAASLEALDRPAIHSLASPTISLLVVVTPDNLFLVRRLLSQAAFYHVAALDLQLVQHGSSPALERFTAHLLDVPTFVDVQVTRTDATTSMDDALRQAVSAASGEIILVLRDDVMIYRGFDYFLSETFRNHPGVDALTGVTAGEGDADRRRFEKAPMDGIDDDKAAYQFINWYGGREVSAYRSASMPALLAVRRRLLADASATSMGALLGGLAAAGRVRVTPSVFYARMPPAGLAVIRQYMGATGRARLELARAMLSGAAYAVFPDVAERLLTDLSGLNVPADELAPISGGVLVGRHYELEAHRSVRRLVKRRPLLTRPLDAKIATLSRIVKRVSTGSMRTRSLPCRPTDTTVPSAPVALGECGAIPAAIALGPAHADRVRQLH